MLDVKLQFSVTGKFGKNKRALSIAGSDQYYLGLVAESMFHVG